MNVRERLNDAIAFLRKHATRMREPVDWVPEAAEKPAYPSDRHGNHTVRPYQKTSTLRATDTSGREWIILEIVPMEPVQGYGRLRVVPGHTRFELKDGTPVVQRGPALFEVNGTTLTVTGTSGE